MRRFKKISMTRPRQEQRVERGPASSLGPRGPLCFACCHPSPGRDAGWSDLLRAITGQFEPSEGGRGRTRAKQARPQGAKCPESLALRLCGPFNFAPWVLGLFHPSPGPGRWFVFCKKFNKMSVTSFCTLRRLNILKLCFPFFFFFF